MRHEVVPSISASRYNLVFIPLMAISWIGPCVKIVCGGALWAFGGRIVRRAVAVAGFVAGIPAAVMISQWFGIAWLPPWISAIVGAFAGVICALLAYRFALAITVMLVAGLVAAIISAAIIDRGLIASDQARALALHRASGLTEALAAAWSTGNPGNPGNPEQAAETLMDQTLQAHGRFWSTLDPPERTLFGASILSCAAAGFFMGLFMRRFAEIAVTATAGSLLISWGISQALDARSPSASAWVLATTVLALIGCAVQSSHCAGSAQEASKKPGPDKA